MIIKRTAIQRDSDKTYFYLPPFNMNVSATPDSTIQIDKNPITGKYKQIANIQNGWDISVSGKYKAATDADGLAFQQVFRNFLRDSTTGNAGKYHFVDWVDDQGNVKRFFQNCYLTKDVEFTPVKSARAAVYSFTLKGSTFPLASTSTDGSVPSNTGPYEILYFNSTNGGSGGSGGSGDGSTNTGGGTIVVYKNAMDTVFGVFNNKITSACGASNYQSRRLRYIPNKASNVVVKDIQISGGGPLDGTKTSGQTTIKLSTVDWNASGGSSVTVSVPYNSNFSDPVDCNIPIVAGSCFYVYVTEATGGHSDLEITISLESN